MSLALVRYKRATFFLSERLFHLLFYLDGVTEEGQHSDIDNIDKNKINAYNQVSGHLVSQFCKSRESGAETKPLKPHSL